MCAMHEQYIIVAKPNSLIPCPHGQIQARPPSPILSSPPIPMKLVLRRVHMRLLNTTTMTLCNWPTSSALSDCRTGQPSHSCLQNPLFYIIVYIVFCTHLWFTCTTTAPQLHHNCTFNGIFSSSCVLCASTFGVKEIHAVLST